MIDCNVGKTNNQYNYRIMKRTLLLMVLALGMLNINGAAQSKKRVPSRKSNTAITHTVTKTREVGEDGFIWYKLKKGNLYGVQDKNGKILVPIKYSFVFYGDVLLGNDFGHEFFLVSDNDFNGIYSKDGRCIISTDRHYTYINLKWLPDYSLFYFQVRGSDGHEGICDMHGYEVIPPLYEPRPFKSVEINKVLDSDDLYISALKNGIMYIFDLDGDLLFSKHCTSMNVRENNINCEIDGKYQSFPAPKFKKQTKNDFVNYNNILRVSTLIQKESKTSSNSSSLNSNFSNNNNSGGGTTTVVVEQHHRDPVPVQDWVPCSVCGHNPGVCQTCVGNKTNFRGDPCISCRGTGKCHFCNGQGGRYQIVYR